MSEPNSNAYIGRVRGTHMAQEADLISAALLDLCETTPLPVLGRAISDFKTSVGCMNPKCAIMAAIQYAPLQAQGAALKHLSLELCHLNPEDKIGVGSVGDYSAGHGAMKPRLNGVPIQVAMAAPQVVLCRGCHDELDGRLS